jgi:hypothetical protein
MLQIDQLKNAESWLALAPGFHIGDENSFKNLRALVPGDNALADLDGRLKYEGYFQQKHDWGLDLEKMAGTVRSFARQNISPVFCYLFDEFWLPFYQLDALYKGLLGDYAMMPDFWVWNVDPKKGDAGWKPHRDKGHYALRPDGSPNSLTTWIPLSNATPLNSCMYIVPANADPTYGTPRDAEWRFELPAVRALPAEPGDFLMWNQAVLHWGSRTSLRADETRVSMAFEFQRLDIPPYNQPLLKPNTPLPFEMRLKLIAKQILQYRHMYRVEPALEQWALKLVG